MKTTFLSKSPPSPQGNIKYPHLHTSSTLVSCLPVAIGSCWRKTWPLSGFLPTVQPSVVGWLPEPEVTPRPSASTALDGTFSHLTRWLFFGFVFVLPFIRPGHKASHGTEFCSCSVWKSTALPLISWGLAFFNPSGFIDLVFSRGVKNLTRRVY